MKFLFVINDVTESNLSYLISEKYQIVYINFNKGVGMCGA